MGLINYKIVVMSRVRATFKDGQMDASRHSGRWLPAGSLNHQLGNWRFVVTDDRLVREGSPPMRSMLDFDEDRTGVQVRRDGLVLPDGMSFDSWRKLGSRVALIANCSAWWLGDWLVYGEQAYGARYEQAISDTSLSYQTLRNYAWVARAFPVSRRRDTLSFGHHVEVAALPEDEQDAWLAQAEELNWSCNKLRRALRTAKLAHRRASQDEMSPHIWALKIDVPSDQHDRWRSAAEQQNCSTVDWIIATLNRVASEELTTEGLGVIAR